MRAKCVAAERSRRRHCIELASLHSSAILANSGAQDEASATPCGQTGAASKPIGCGARTSSGWRHVKRDFDIPEASARLADGGSSGSPISPPTRARISRRRPTLDIISLHKPTNCCRRPAFGSVWRELAPVTMIETKSRSSLWRKIERDPWAALGSYLTSAIGRAGQFPRDCRSQGGPLFRLARSSVRPPARMGPICRLCSRARSAPGTHIEGLHIFCSRTDESFINHR